MTVLGECWDDTHKIVKCNQVCLSTHVDEVVPSHLLTRRGVFVVFLLVIAELLLRVMRNPCLFACARYTYLLYQGSDPAENCFEVDPTVDPETLNTSESSRVRLCRSAAKCDTHCELLNIDTSARVITSQIPSARVINT